MVQMNIKDGDPRKNWATMQELCQEAARRGAELVVFPELWDNGYMLDKAKEFASPMAGGLFAQVGALAKQLNIFILGSMLEKRGVGVYNTCAVFSPRTGTMGAYRKIHLFEPLQEPLYLSPGEAPLSVDLPWGTTGIAICYDLRFPELLRRYAVEGAKVLVLPAEWPQARINHWRTLLQARAIENQYFVIGCNRVGEYNGTVFGGHSMIVDPWGNLVAEAGEGETIITAKFNTDMVDEVRQKLPVLGDRRPSLYS
ncbi:MAG: carbon-nitrogen family hydrolase [Anaerolineales bacterium]|nr:carbon-nitrogen family hydrolase [Anaerolineales bacterium]